MIDELNKLYKELELIKEIVKKEGKDVEKLEKLSFTNLIATLSGRKESKLEKEIDDKLKNITNDLLVEP